MTTSSSQRRWRSLAILAALLLLAAGPADARAGRGGFSFGSRGARTYQAPPATPTAPSVAAPIQRSQAAPGQPSAGGYQPGYQRPWSQPGRGGLFSGLGGGFLGGLLGAGLFGLLLGNGLFGGFGGLGSMLGLILQLGLVFFLVRWAISAFQRWQQPAGAGRGVPPGEVPAFRRPPTYASVPPRPAPGPRDAVGIKKPDFDAFERLLLEIQAAYGSEDSAAIRRRTTPEMAGYLEEELAENAARGVVNHVENVCLLQGDLAESWREGDTDYATVAMRFALRDWTVERAGGRLVEGDQARPTEATEIWTFARRNGGSWLVSAIQQSR